MGSHAEVLVTFSGAPAGGPPDPTQACQTAVLCCIQVPGDFSQEGSRSWGSEVPSVEHGDFQCQVTPTSGNKSPDVRWD